MWNLWYISFVDNAILNLLKVISFIEIKKDFCSFLYILEDGLLTTILSSVFIAAFISCVLAAVTTTDNGTPCPSVNK
jgi:hypothetical protein